MNKKNNGRQELSYSHDDSEVSFKEENFFNMEFIEMINSTSGVINFYYFIFYVLERKTLTFEFIECFE
jgi:hypothetical protein